MASTEPLEWWEEVQISMLEDSLKLLKDAAAQKRLLEQFQGFRKNPKKFRAFRKWLRDQRDFQEMKKP